MIYWEEGGRHPRPRIWGKASLALQPKAAAAAAAAEVVVVAAASATSSAALSTSRGTWFC